jgi:LCP family protein required for cell wall assembly
VAALLSFVWPGLGQLYLGRRRLAALFAIPAILAVLLLWYALRRGAFVLAAQLFADRTVGLITVVLLLGFGVWRLIAVGHAYLTGGASRTRTPVQRSILVALAAVIVLMHLGSGYYVLAVSNAGTEIFNPGGSTLVAGATPSGSPAPGQSAPVVTAGPVTTPSIDNRVTILFTGFDSAPSRQEKLYDSIMVVSYDPKTNSVQMISVPRDSSAFPLYFAPDQSVPFDSFRINSVPGYVDNDWIHSPETGPDRGYLTLLKEVQYLVGVHIDYYAAMDMDTFVKMIDAVGGIDVVNPSIIEDPVYDWLDGSPYGFYLDAGPQHLNGRNALAYVRARYGTAAHPDNDYDRSSRQQQVLVALLHKMAQPSELFALPGLMSTMASGVQTNFPSSQVADYVAIGQNVPSGNFTQIVLSVDAGYSIWPRATSSASCLLNYKVAQLSRKLFGSDSLWTGKPDPANTCPSS